MTKLEMINRYGQFDSNTIEAAVIAALSITPYIRYRGSMNDVRNNYADVIKQLDRFLMDLNEIRPFNIDKAKLSGYRLFEIRYKQAIHPDADQLLNEQNTLHTELLKMTSIVPTANLINDLNRAFMAILKANAVEE